MKCLAAWLVVLALITLSLSAYAQESSALREGDQGDQVTKLQERLIELGFLDAEADGIYGKKTAAAVKSFHALLLERAGGSAAKATGSSISADDLEVLYLDPFSFYVSDLASGASGSEVTRLQSALIRLNYMEGEADGYFGDYTESAVKFFQQLNSLPATGIADQATQDLAASGGVTADHPVYRALKKGDKGASVLAMQEKLVELGLMEAPADGYFGSDTQEALELFQDYLTEQGDSFAIGETSAASIEVQEKLEGDIPAFLSALSSGSKDSSEVKRLQRRLNSLGYLNRKTIDGAYGSGTQEAIRLFQTNNGLTETGEADEATQRLLFSKGPVEMLTKYRLYVSLDEQRVYVYQLVGKEYVEIKNFACSTGLGNRTPRGVFTNTIPGRRWHYFKEFSIWAQYAFSIEGDILFHSVLFNRKGGSPTYASVYNLGRRASHGCIRLAVENAKWIYENCARGTVVTIN